MLQLGGVLQLSFGLILLIPQWSITLVVELPVAKGTSLYTSLTNPCRPSKNLFTFNDLPQPL